YAPVSSIAIKPNPRNSPDPAIQREAEGEKVLKALEPRDFVVVLDERGQELRSEDLARLVAAAGDDGRPLAFCIGGPYGHSDAVRARADRMVRLSVMVLNHQVAVVVLLEQLYRAWTILRGVPYHH
ncbi:putative RNA methyltransferase At5g10620, partial [Tetrabaena socialis]